MKLNEKELELLDWALDMLHDYLEGVERDDEADVVKTLRLKMLNAELTKEKTE